MTRIFRAIFCFGMCLFFAHAGSAQVTADFTANVTAGCAPIVVQFTDLSTGGPTQWHWDLGNGTTSALQNPSTTYITPGIYTVSLTVTNAGGSNTKTITGYIEAGSSPTPSFRMSDSLGICAPVTIQFTNTTNPPALSYKWDFGDGSTSSLTAPSHLYNAAGNYIVTLVASNSNGCNKSVSKNIQVVNKPVSGFSSSNNTGCVAPHSVSFNNTTTGAVSWLWSFGDGGTSTQQNPTHIYNAPGTYTVQLISRTIGGCADTLTRTSFVSIGKPTAAFTPNVTSICLGGTIGFTNNSTGTVTSYQWRFGDGSTSTAASPTRNYAAAGTYVVTLVARNGNCSDSISRTVTVLPKPSVSFAADSSVGCKVPHTVRFTNNSSGAASYLWRFGDGATSTAAAPTHTYTVMGNYSVMLVATGSNGCADSLVLGNYIKLIAPVATISRSPANLCPGDTASFGVTLSAPNVISTASWNFGDGGTGTGTSIKHAFVSPGTYTVTVSGLTVTGCTFNVTSQVTVGIKPTASFTASPLNVCVNQLVNFISTSTNATSYAWQYGDGSSGSGASPSHAYNDSGLYTVRLIAINNNCRDTSTRVNLIRVAGPDARFTVSRSCNNRLSLTFTNNSVGAGSYLWNFGDGGSSTQTSPVHTYAATGTYRVVLTATDPVSGCKDSLEQSVTLYDPPVVSFSADDTIVCKGTSVSFTRPANPPGYSYAWSFGDGTSSGAATTVVNKIYTQTGAFTVRLIVTDGNGCRDTFIREHYIRVGGPSVQFTAAPVSGCSPLTVTFTDQSAVSGSTITDRTWNFGDGTILAGNNPSPVHTFVSNTAQNYTVKLVVTDGTGCKDSLSQTNLISVRRPAGNFSNPARACKGAPITFTASGSGITSYSWDFGDGSTGTGSPVSHVYNSGGQYTVRLIISDANGCRDTIEKTNVILIDEVIAGFTMSDSVVNCPPLIVDFRNTSTGATTYLWSMGNNNMSTNKDPSSVYFIPGVYTVRLVASGNGCSDSTTRNITVGGPYGTFDYTPVAGCAPFTINFSSVATNTLTYSWDMQNGTTQSTGTGSFSYTYTQPGDYLPVLVLGNGSCNVAIVGTDTIRVDGLEGDFNFSASGNCERTEVSFFDTVYSSRSPLVSREWSFGDGGSSTLHNPVHVYTTPGTYSIRLILGNGNGCKDTILRSITVNGLPPVSAGGPRTICAGTSLQLQATGAASYSWSPAAGLSCTACDNPVASPGSSITYVVTGTDTNGCSDTASVAITVGNVPVLSVTPDTSVCFGEQLVLSASGATDYSWSPATGLSCSNCSNPGLTAAATVRYTVIGSNSFNCADTAEVLVTVNPKPTVTTTPSQDICTGTSLALQAAGAQNYVWSPATGLSCTACDNPVASPATTTTYTVTGTDAFGCKDTAQLTVSVVSGPTIIAAGRGVCLNDSVTMLATGANTYSWSPATGLSCTNCPDPKASPPATTTYTIVGTLASGCKDSIQTTVTVHLLPVVSAGNDRDICSGESTNLSATGANTYSWSPAAGLSCTGCPNPVAGPPDTATYIVRGISTDGCINYDTVTVNVKPLPVISAGADQTICVNTRAQLQATGGVSYVWNADPTLSCINCDNPTATPSVNTTYIVRGTGANGCTDTAQVTVNLYPRPVIGGGTNQSVCIGDSVRLQASGGVSYSWSPATGLSCTGCSDPWANPSATTTYTVKATNADGCTDSAQVTVSVHLLPVVSAGNDRDICSGESANLSATGASTYTWSPAAGLSCTNCSSPVASPPDTATYIVRGISTDGCINYDTVTVNVKPLPVISAGSNQIICDKTSAQLQATGGVSYVWNADPSLSCTACPDPVATPSVNTTYTVRGTGANGCTDTAQVTVNLYPRPVISGGTNQGLCIGDSVQLQASGGVSYSWSPATGLSCTGCSDPWASPLATTTYTVRATNADGCIDSAQVTVTVNLYPVVSAGSDQAICSGESANLSATGASIYSWSPATGLSCTNCPNPVASPGTTITYRVVGATTAGCSDTAEVTIRVNPLPQIAAGSDQTICKGNTVQLQATGGDVYAWSPATGLSCVACPDPEATPPSPMTYTVTGTDSNGCSNTSQVQIRFYPQPPVNAGPDQTICHGDSAVLHASGAVDYTWSPAGSLSCTACPDPVVSPAADFSYWVTGTDANNCSDSDQVNVFVIQRQPTSVGSSIRICAGQEAQLHAAGGIRYEWSPATALSCTNCPDPISLADTTTLYRVAVTQNQCFTDTLYQLVEVFPVPTVDLGGDLRVFAGESVRLYANSAYASKYEWSPADWLSCSDCVSPVATPESTITYSVTAYNALGCTATDQITITLKCDKTMLFVPNTFTPNGDGENDRFFPHANGISHVDQFRVYSRWGEVIFDQRNMPVNNPVYGWDGTFKGQVLNPDTYVYILQATCINGDKVELKGDISLIR